MQNLEAIRVKVVRVSRRFFNTHHFDFWQLVYINEQQSVVLFRLVNVIDSCCMLKTSNTCFLLTQMFGFVHVDSNFVTDDCSQASFWWQYNDWEFYLICD